MTLLVFGSINMDLVARTPRLPAPAETITGHEFFTAPGGKGANQAVAAGRLQIPTKMVGRVGGDEFVVVVDDTTSTDEVAGIADAALAALSTPFSIDGHELAISASVGVVEQAIKDTSIADMFKAADTTLSWAKAAGKGRRMLFDADRHVRAQRAQVSQLLRQLFGSIACGCIHA